MDTTPKQLLALGKKILSELQAIAEKLSLLRDVLQQQIDTANEQSKANKETPDQPLPVTASLSTPVAISVQAETHERKSKWQRVFKGLEILGIAAVAAYAVITYFMWTEMKHTTEQAVHSVSIAQKQLEFSERPWIKIVELKTRGNNKVLPALSFRGYGYGLIPQGKKGVTFQLDILAKNIGHSVAEIDDVDYELFLPLWDGQGPDGASTSYPNVVMAEKNRYCSESIKRPPLYGKIVVFPDEPFNWGEAVEQQILPGSINHIEGHPTTEYILPVVIVCVNYRLPGLEQVYQSSTLYEVSHSDDRTRFFPVGIDIPANRILLTRNRSADDAR